MSLPIRDAIIVAEPGDPLRPVARVPLLVRTILTLQREGIERCTLVGALPRPADRRIRCTLATAPALAASADDALRLIVGSGAVIDRSLVRELQARVRPGEVLELEHEGARVRVAPGRLVDGNGGARGEPRRGTLRPAGAPDLERVLLSGLENPRDGYVDRVLHRPLSRPITRVLARTPVTPNAITIAGIALGVLGGLVLGMPGAGAVPAAVLLLVASGVLDCSDGEIARLRFAESRLGHWLDVGGDTVVHLAVLAGIATRIERAGDAPGWPTLAVLFLGVCGAFAVITWSEHMEDRRRAAGGWENAVLDRVLSPLTTRDWHVFPVLFALAGRLDLLVPAAAVGAHAFWAVSLVILRRALRRASS
jgi:phosphatidylglycerophosphate synthase